MNGRSVYMKKSTFLTIFAVALLTSALHAEIIERVLVKVNGEIITKTELERMQVAAFRELPNQPDPSKMTDADVAKILAQVTPQVIVSAIDEMLLLQRAKELGFTITDQQFNEVIESIKRDNKMESEEQFQAALKQEGMTLAQLKQMLSKRMLIGRVQQAEIGGRVDITEAEEKEYYQKHLSEFATTPSVTLREILVTVPKDPKGVSVGADEDARRKAEDLRARVLKGESFEKLAAEVSEAASRANGGLIGPIPRTELNEQLLKMLATMKVGDVTPVVSVPGGYEIFKLESSIDSTTLPFEHARSQVQEKLRNEKAQGELRKHMAKLRAQAIIEWKDPELKKAWEVGVSAEPTF
jgi:peptidyl-prolyl cis-trans isomerase SurA